MTLKDDNGFIPLSGQLPFFVTPEDILFRVREDWLGQMENGFSPILDTLIPYLQVEAIARLKRDPALDNLPWYPDRRKDGHDAWLGFWLNEAAQNCCFTSSLGEAGEHLTEIGKAAANILVTCDALRTAIASGQAEKASALSILLILESLQGGYAREHDAAQEAIKTIENAKRGVFERTIGKFTKDLDLAKTATIEVATRTWESHPEHRIGDVAKIVRDTLIDHKNKFSTDFDFPVVETIKGWIRSAGEQGKISIPSGAQARGRPRTKK